MTTKQIKCRDHGGIFSVPARRGRPPVRCTDENPCSAVGRSTPPSVSRTEQTASKIKNKRLAARNDVEPSSTRRVRKGAKKAKDGSMQPLTDGNSLTLAKTAKAQLEAVGWVVKGRSWHAGDADMAQITASRGEETITLIWKDGQLVCQDYSMWSVKSSENNMPESKLGFDPSEMTDGELARRLAGMKVTWWNRLAGSNESGIVGSKITINHVFMSNGDEDNTKRVVTFVDKNDSGYRSFHVDALLKIG